MKILFVSLLSLLILIGCSKTASEHRAEVEDSVTEKITVGNVQREVRTGMSGGEVASILGSPNIVSTDADRNEVWVYDKISTTTSKSSSNSSFWYVSPAGAISTNQKTLTVIIKFDKNKEVRDFSYRQSSF
jgi:outer membrane protein assembly factor BamE (lipoprotein component of BamABCDE complex)|tara:strand:- start:228 stop:620 length:393 start_codon:yes stop_codon:yes gene_type:complete